MALSRRARAVTGFAASRWLPVLLLFLAIAPRASRATPVLDQVANPDGGSFFQDNDLEPVQSFTVGRTGHLTEIDLWSTTTPLGQTCCTLVLSSQFSPVAGLQGGQPSDGGLYGAIVGQVSLSSQGDPGPIFQGWNAFVFSNPIPVTAGEVLYFTLIQDNDIAWGTSSYAGGSMAWLCFNDGCIDPANPAAGDIPPGTVVFPASDWAFRTFVPEPSSARLLVVAALLGGALGAFRRRRGRGLPRLGCDAQEAGLEA